MNQTDLNNLIYHRNVDVKIGVRVGPGSGFISKHSSSTLRHSKVFYPSSLILWFYSYKGLSYFKKVWEKSPYPLC